MEFSAAPPLYWHQELALLAEMGFAHDIGMTVWRVLGGFVIAAALAVPLGVAMGAYKPIEAFFEPFVSFARYLPASAFIPLLILWVGIGEAQKLAVIFIGSFFQLVLMVAVILWTVADVVLVLYEKLSDPHQFGRDRDDLGRRAELFSRLARDQRTAAADVEAAIVGGPSAGDDDSVAYVDVGGLRVDADRAQRLAEIVQRHRAGDDATGTAKALLRMLDRMDPSYRT